MKLNDKDLIICFFILVFLAQGVGYFRLNKLDKITQELTIATTGLYEVYRLDRQLDQLDMAINGVPTPIYPLRRNNEIKD